MRFRPGRGMAGAARGARVIPLIVLILASTGASPTFETHWQDGKAELDEYRYTITRYGRVRTGTAVMIYVTEPFSDSKRVKADNPEANPRDTFEALKLNFVRDFQTGIYDYNTMSSLFVRSRDFSPVKISFSSAEWCGHVYEEVLFNPREIATRYTSYFEDESGERRIAPRSGSVTEETLLVLLRDLRGPWLNRGERRRVPFLDSAFYRRLTHKLLAWSEATIARNPSTVRVTVPAGQFETTLYSVDVGGQREGRFWIEQAYPHRVVRWEWKAILIPAGRGQSPAEGLDAGELTGSARLPYWKLHDPGDESYLKLLGLPAGPGSATASPR